MNLTTGVTCTLIFISQAIFDFAQLRQKQCYGISVGVGGARPRTMLGELFVL